MFLAGPEIRPRYDSSAMVSGLAAAMFVLPVEDIQVSFDFVAIEQLVLENVETDIGISNVALMWPQML